MRRVWIAAIFFCCAAALADQPTTTLDAQRAAFAAHWPAAQSGDWTANKRDEALLRAYPLWPDIRAAWLGKRLDRTSDRQILRFLNTHDGLRPARSLRYAYTLHLAKKGDWRGFDKLYAAHYTKSRDARLDCLALQSGLDHHDKANRDQITQEGIRLYLVPRSQDERCDHAFKQLQQSGRLDDSHIQARLDLTLKARNYSLAAYLAKQLDEVEQARVRSWQRMANDPARGIAAISGTATSEQLEQMVYGVKKLALSDAPAAHGIWQQAQSQHTFNADQVNEVSRHIAIAAAQDHEAVAAEFLAALPDAAVDQRVLEWRVRSALLNDDQPTVLREIASMSASEAAAERWQYWEAHALAATGQADPAQAMFETLAKERSYYGFMAADRIGTDYQFNNVPLQANAALLEQMAGSPQGQRIRELNHQSLGSRARREWQDWNKGFNREQIRAGAVMAHQWDWHSQAITDVATIGEFDDIALRFPLAYTQLTQSHSSKHNIEQSWVLAIARNESLFITDVRSSAGAIGIMQLTPPTGRQTARQIGLRWQGNSTLTEPEHNIALGTAYLAMLAQRFEHIALATAAYNAGPHKVTRWHSSEHDMPASLWIETIAYDETRDYVQRVLASLIIYRHRLGAPAQRLSDYLPPIKRKQPVS